MSPTLASSRCRSWEIITTAPSKSSSSVVRRSRRDMSRWASGSSSSSTSGRRARQAASATSLRWPPESSRVGVPASIPSARRWPSASPSARSPPASVHAASARSWRARAFVIASRSAASAGSARRRSAACSSVSSATSSGRAERTVVSASRSSPSTICGRWASTSPRRRVTRPASGVSRPTRIRIKVDLPPPLGPSTPIRAPASTSRSAPRRIARPPKDFVRPRAASTDMSASVAARGVGGNRASRTHDASYPHRARAHRAPGERRRGRRRAARAARRGRGRGLARRAGRAARAAVHGALGPAPGGGGGDVDGAGGGDARRARSPRPAARMRRRWPSTRWGCCSRACAGWRTTRAPRRGIRSPSACSRARRSRSSAPAGSAGS